LLPPVREIDMDVAEVRLGAVARQVVPRNGRFPLLQPLILEAAVESYWQR
jgi:hypothetical protein